jgi:uncharacterized membrane protein YoaK (UPF0700 family)
MDKFNKNILIWSTSLCFLSGALNTLGITEFYRGVTHITGSFSNLSIGIVNEDFVTIKYLTGLISCFFLGSIISGLIIGKREFSLKKRYGIIIVGIGIILAISSKLFCEENQFMLLLALISGIQNGLFISYKGMVVRTTHVTGGITDLGVFIGNYLRYGKGEIWKIQFHFILLVGFFLGGIFGVLEGVYFEEEKYYILSLGYIFLGFIYFLWRNLYRKIS